VAHLIHRGRGEVIRSVLDVSGALSAWGFKNAYDVAIRHGVVDCAAAIEYVAAQRGRYAARNPGGLVRWLLRNAYNLQGWHRGRVLGFLPNAERRSRRTRNVTHRRTVPFTAAAQNLLTDIYRAPFRIEASRAR
jgi:hypothetical protein